MAFSKMDMSTLASHAETDAVAATIPFLAHALFHRARERLVLPDSAEARSALPHGMSPSRELLLMALCRIVIGTAAFPWITRHQPRLPHLPRPSLLFAQTSALFGHGSSVPKVPTAVLHCPTTSSSCSASARPAKRAALQPNWDL